MRRIDADSRPAWAARRLASLVPEVEADERHQWAEEALRIVNDPAFAHLFGAHARHEAAMRVRTPEGEPMTGRADVLVIEGERVDIVDFKTDRHPQRPIPASHAYARQMQAYRSALQAIHPAATITTALLWTVDARLEVIPPL
jgi:ATP-dependent helicase/nuclease subunit A